MIDVNPDPLPSDASPPSRLSDVALDKVWRVLNRNVGIDSLGELRNGLDEAVRRPPVTGTQVLALGFDTNAIYRVGLNGTQGADAVDFLGQQHRGPLVIPGQAVQEIWNNLLSGVEPQAKRLRKKFDDLTKEMDAIDQSTGETGEAVKGAIDELVRVHGDWIDPGAHEVFDGTLQTLLTVGDTAYVPRSEFYALARIRKETKTPPGFLDPVNNHGDFFVWADFLYGLARADLTDVDAAILVTNDVKSDWSRNGVAHPVLVAEAVTVAEVPFRLWTVSDFHRYVKDLQTALPNVDKGDSSGESQTRP